MANNINSMDNRSVARVQVEQGVSVAPIPTISSRRANPAVWLLAGLAMLAVCAVATIALWLVGLGSVFDKLASVTVGELRLESKSVPQGSAASVAVNLDMGQGTLTLAGGATNLMDADFTYNVDAWQPRVAYTESGTQGTLNVEQNRLEGFIRTPDGVRNDWNVHLKVGIPLTIRANMGAGTSTLNLGGLSVSKLDMSTGVGAVTLDLTGNWEQSLSATLQAGAGDTTIRLPKGVGVRIKVDSGVSDVDSGGLNRNGNTYTNAAYGTIPVTVEIAIKSGIGNVKIEQAR